MKIILLVMSLFATSHGFAQAKRPLASEIQNANIICVNSQRNIEISINTNKGHIWFRNLSSSSNVGLEVQGPVFSGIYSSEKFTGEVLGEITLSQTEYYVTLILRNKNSQAVMETLLYPKKDQSQVLKFFSDKCELK